MNSRPSTPSAGCRGGSGGQSTRPVSRSSNLTVGERESVCQVIVDERDDEVYVRVAVCYEDEDDVARSRHREYVDCPVPTPPMAIRHRVLITA